MANISISLIQFLIIGIPQGFLFVLAIYIYTKTKFNLFKYLLLSSVFTVITYLIRFLPISIGVNSMLSLLILILMFLILYKLDLTKIIKLIINVILIMLVISALEIINELMLQSFGVSQKILNASVPLTKSLYMIPSNIMFAVFVLISYLIMKNPLKKESEINGNPGEEISE